MKVKRDHEATFKELKTIKRPPARFSLIIFSLDLSDTNSRAEWENPLELIASLTAFAENFFVRAYPNSEGKVRS